MEYLGKAEGFGIHEEFNFIGKWRSRATQCLIFKDLQAFDNQLKTESTAVIRYALHASMNAFTLPSKVKVMHLIDIFQQDLDIWSQSPGLPWVELGYKTKGDIQRDPDAITQVRKFAHFVKNSNEIKTADCLAYARSYVSDKGQYKVKPVWRYPATITFCEAMFAVPLIRAYQANQLMAYKYEALTDGVDGMRKLMNRFRPSGNAKYYASVVFKNFHKTVPAWLIDCAFDVLLLNINFCEYEGYEIPNANKILNLFDYLHNYFINTTIRLADGSRYRKSSGIPSGSYFTQLIGSVVNYIVIKWMSLELFGYSANDLIVLGANSLFSTKTKLDLIRCNIFLSTNLGMEIDTERSQISDTLKHLKLMK